MKKMFTLTLAFLLVLTACTTGDDNTSSAVESSEPEIEEELSLDVDLFKEDDELSGTLVISSDSLSEYIPGYYGVMPLVEGFKELHPNVDVIVEGINSADSSLSDEEIELNIQKYKEDMKINMVAGNVPDLIFTSSDYTSSFATSGHIMNLNAFIQNDPSFNEEDFFMQVLDAAESGGALYNMPNTIRFELFRLSEDVLKEVGIDPNTLETIDYKFLLDVYNKAVSSGKFPELTSIGAYGSEGQALLHLFEITNATDSKNMTANFNTPEFIEYLNLTKAYTGASTTFGSFSGPVQNDIVPFADDSYFAERVMLMLFFEGMDFVVNDIDGVTEPIPVVTSSGELPVRSKYNMSIPTNAKNPALAWEFIKYCIYESEEVGQIMDLDLMGKWNGDRFGQEIPINKNNFKKYVDSQLIAYSEEEKNKVINLYENALNLPLRTTNYDIYLPVFEGDIWSDFYEKDGMYTAEEVARGIQEKVDIYLAEIA